MHPYSTKSHYVKYAGSVTSDYAINTISSCVLVFHCHHQSLHWRRFLPKSTLYGWLEAMEFDVTQLTQDVEQSLFTIKTNIPISMLVYGDSFHWAKYGHHILPSNLDLTSHTKTVLHQTFWNSLNEFLHTDLDGNLLPSNLDLTRHNKAGIHQTFRKSLVELLCTDFLIKFLCTDLDENLAFTFNPLTASKLDHFLSTLFERMSETANKGKVFDQHVWNEKSKHHLINEVVDIAQSATQITLSIFTNLFQKGFEKHSMLELTLEILQRFYIQIETEPHDFLLFSWRFFLINLKVYEMLPACYSLWFNWTNSITCTHCNVISLEHDSIP
jgi:hypothetical protein